MPIEGSLEELYSLNEKISPLQWRGFSQWEALIAEAGYRTLRAEEAVKVFHLDSP